MPVRLLLGLALLCASLRATVTNVTDAAGLIAAVSTCASGDQINIKSGAPYVLTAVIAIASTCGNMVFQGYQTTPGDGGTKPLITTATDATDLFSTASVLTGGVTRWDNISFSNTAATRGNGMIQVAGHATLSWWLITNSVFDGFVTAINSDDNGSHFDVFNIALTNDEFKNNTAAGANGSGVSTNNGALYIDGCWFHDSTGSGPQILTYASVSPTYIGRTIVTGGAGQGVKITGGSLAMDHNTIAGNTLEGLYIPSTTSPQSSAQLFNNVIWSNGSGIDPSMPAGIIGGGAGAIAVGPFASRNNAFGSNRTGNIAQWTGTPGEVLLSVDPFTNAAGGNYSPNTAATGGALLRGAGWPGVFPGGLSTGHPTIGAVEPVAPGAFALAAP